MAASKEFEKSMAVSKTAVKRWKEAKKAKPSGFSLPDIQSGNYIARVTAEGKKNQQGTRIVTLRTTIVQGECVGKGWNNNFYLDGDDEEKVQQNWNRLSVAMQLITDEDTSEMSENELNAWLIEKINEIDEQAPYVRIGVKRNVDAKDKTKFYLNTYFNELLDADVVRDETEEEENNEEEGSSEEDDNTSDDDGDDSEEEEEGEDSEESEEDDGEGEEAVEPEKGDFVWYKPKGKRSDIECQVVTVNKRNKTANLKESEGTGKWDAVPFDACEVVMEE